MKFRQFAWSAKINGTKLVDQIPNLRFICAQQLDWGFLSLQLRWE